MGREVDVGGVRLFKYCTWTVAGPPSVHLNYTFDTTQWYLGSIHFPSVIKGKILVLSRITYPIIVNMAP